MAKSMHVTFIPGTFHDGRMWEKSGWVKHFEDKGYHVETPSIYDNKPNLQDANFADTSRAFRKQGLAEISDYFAGIVKSNGEKTHLVGWSQGATISQRLAAGETKELIQSASLLSPPAPYGSLIGILNSLPIVFKAPKSAPKILASLVSGGSLYKPSRGEANRLLFNTLDETNADIWYNLRLSSAFTRAGLEEGYSHLDIHKTHEIQGEINVPSLVVAGDQDKLINYRASKKVAQKWGSQFHLIKEGSHCIPYDKTSSMCKFLVQDFLESQN